MSAKAQAYVWESSPYSGTKLIIHLAIADVANDDKDNLLWMAQESVARKCRCDRKTVTRTFAQMCDDGFLVMIENNSRAKQPNVYRFMMPDVSGTFDPEPSGSGTFDPPGVTSRPVMVSKCPSNSIELKENSKRTTYGASVAAKYSPEFELFWKAYPRRAGSKSKAASYFATAMKKTSVAEIMDAVENQTAAWKREGTQTKYIPWPTTWLNGERWNDEIETHVTVDAAKGNAQFGKNFLPFEYTDDRDMMEKLGCEVFSDEDD